MRHSHRNADKCRYKDSPEKSAFHVPDDHQTTDYESYECQQNRRIVKVGKDYLRVLMGNNDATVLQTDKGDEETNRPEWRWQSAL